MSQGLRRRQARTLRHGPRPFRLRAVLFDFDGTLTRPGALDFAALKREVGCPPGSLVLEWIEALPAGARREDGTGRAGALRAGRRRRVRAERGRRATSLRGLRRQGLKIGILTRNGLPAVRRALSRFRDLDADDFDVIVTRDDEIPPKPAPDGVLHAARRWACRPRRRSWSATTSSTCEAGRAAGAVTAYLTNGADGELPGQAAHELDRLEDADCDFVVHGLAELDDVVRLGLPLPPGKLPNDLLAGHLRGLAAADPSVLVPAGIGEDVTALDIGGADTLVAHGDPITLSSRDLAAYAVLVNANDIAAAGGVPRWLLTTVLLPAGTTRIRGAGAAGGPRRGRHQQRHRPRRRAHRGERRRHRPVVSATMLGTMRRADLRDKRDVLPGDQVILTKALAVEGTALLAEELGERLRALGMSAARARRLPASC